VLDSYLYGNAENFFFSRPERGRMRPLSSG